MTGILLNGKQAVSAVVFFPGTGVWVADVDIDLDESMVVPFGRATLVIGTSALVGTVDSSGSGRMGTKARVQILGGGGGWSADVPSLHLHNDFGVTTTTVFSVTASAVGEVVIDESPAVLGTDFVRSAGPASRVLAGRSWYVDAAGVTHVGARLPAALNPDADIIEWDPHTKRAIVASESTLLPGTVLIDSRFGRAIVRDVEQTFASTGSRAIAWCELSDAAGSDVGSRILRAIGAVSRESVGAVYMRRHAYRVVAQGIDGRLTLQVVTPGATPEILQAVAIWGGMPGVSSKVSPGTQVTVEFIAGDPAKPIATSFSPDSPTPIEVTIDAARVAVGAGALPVVVASPELLAWIVAVGGFTGVAPPLPANFVSTKLFSE